jgi:asparagine synthase (glutamine-hydrolysing)
MSAQAGMFYFDGRPIDPELPKRLGASIAQYGPDGGGAFVGPGLVMVQRALYVTPEDPRERQPYVSTRGNVMTWDGRLDNRDDLLLQLWMELDADDTTDVALAMRVFEKWGLDGFAKLIGDWSLTIWQPESRALVCASDYMGVRALYYCHSAESFAWSTDLGSLVDYTGRGGEIEERFMAGFLTFAPSPDLTPYRGVLSVSPAHALSISLSGVPAKKCFWSLGGTRLTYKNADDYGVHLRTVFRESVRARLRAAGPVWAELSGGLQRLRVRCEQSHTSVIVLRKRTSGDSFARWKTVAGGLVLT